MEGKVNFHIMKLTFNIMMEIFRFLTRIEIEYLSTLKKHFKGICTEMLKYKDTAQYPKPADVSVR